MGTTCQRCGKEPATVHLTDLLKGQKKERHLCNTCAEEEGLVPQQAPLNEILSKFVMQKSAVKELVDLTCEQCGMTFVEFRSHGLLGCPNDYDAFQKALEPLLARSHEGAVQHIGKLMPRIGDQFKVRQELMQLRKRLQRAVDDEQYEEAARLRDRISTLESS